MEGLRIVFEVKRDSEPLVVLNNLYKRSALQSTFSANMMAVVGAGRLPEMLTLRSALQHFVDFRIETLRRRSRSRLAKTEARLHIVEGLLSALSQMNEVIEAIRGADSVAGARGELMSVRFNLTEPQAEALLSMQLRRLTALETESLVKESADLNAKVPTERLIAFSPPRCVYLGHLIA